MTAPFEFDRRLTKWLEDTGAAQTPDYLDALLDRTRQTRQRPAWASLERWLPVQLSIIRRPLVAVPRAAWVFLIVILVAALALLAVGFAGRRHLPPPIGPAANGLIAVDDHGAISARRLDGSIAGVLSLPTEAAADPTWSADGTRLAFYSFPRAVAGPSCAADAVPVCDGPDSPVGSVVVLNADGSGRVVLAHDRQLATEALMAPVWSHDGTRIAFSYRPAFGQRAIDVVDLRGTVVGHVDDGDMPTWSPDDTKLAYRVYDDGAYVVGVATGSQPHKISQAGGRGFAFSAPAWSPDGTQLAYYAGPDGGHDIYVVNADGTSERQISHSSVDEYWPDFSPDGERIAFERVVDDKNDMNFVVTDLAGASERLLQMNPLAGAPSSWSPDGRYLVGHALSADGSQLVGLLLVDVADPSRSITVTTTGSWYAWQRVAP